LYSINLGNRFSEIIHMVMASTDNEGSSGFWVIGVYFTSFYIMSQLLLFQLLSGWIIGIFLCYYKPPMEDKKKPEDKLLRDTFESITRTGNFRVHYTNGLSQHI
jgi:hypothetical protein